MHEFELTLQSGHLLAAIDGAQWLVDTGSPASFGRVPAVRLAGRVLELGSAYFGLDARALSGFIGVEVCGLLGTDVLGQFDLELDVAGSSLKVSQDLLDMKGSRIQLDEFMGVPILQAKFHGKRRRMFFDTGAQISYLQDEGLESFRPAGDFEDFFPGIGKFRTDTYVSPFTVGEISFELRCGQLPDLLALTLSMAEVEGIIGNEICIGRRVGYSARRGILVIA